MTIIIPDSRAVNIAKLERLAQKAGKPFGEYVAEFFKKQVEAAWYRSLKGI